jgi:hypothetical protein
MSAGCSSGRTAIVDIAAYEHVVEVITDPPGARIVVNDDMWRLARNNSVVGLPDAERQYPAYG